MTDNWVWMTLVRVAPILGFLLTITVVAELADAAGVFEAASVLGARGARGSVRRLWFLVLVLASVTTMLLSLDTTAVLLTPVVLVLSRRLGIAPWPFALATVWLANTASLLLPVSNLTNLLLINRLHWSVSHYTTRMWIPALVAVAISVVILALLMRGSLGDRYEVPLRPTPDDRLLFRLAVGVCVAVGPLFIFGVPPWLVGSVGAIVLLVGFSYRDRSKIGWRLLPWRLVVITLSLFLIVGFLQRHGLTGWLAELAGKTSNGLGGLLRMSGTGALSSNLVNNLPAYVALEPVAANSPERLLALLIGTNLGPLITMWGSLATLLWRERCRTVGVAISASRFAVVGLVGVPVLLFATTTALWLTV
ncbi:MAG TPA: SLC13 family permease [Candidatus Nanopelagicaceae bacterium]|nr:SLC13 family permease [Candidatus Nanopelagicaceae bacterium]